MAHLFRHGGSTKELEQDLAQWGAPPPEYLEAIEAQETFEIWPENIEPLQIFMRLQTQWRHGMTGPTGLDYAGVRAALALMDVEPTAKLFELLQAMEAQALRIMSGAENGT